MSDNIQKIPPKERTIVLCQGNNLMMGEGGYEKTVEELIEEEGSLSVQETWKQQEMESRSLQKSNNSVSSSQVSLSERRSIQELRGLSHHSVFCSTEGKKRNNDRSPEIDAEVGKKRTKNRSLENDAEVRGLSNDESKNAAIKIPGRSKIKLSMNMEPSADKEIETINTGEAVFVTNLPYGFDTAFFSFLCPTITQIEVGSARNSAFLMFPNNAAATNACMVLDGYLKRSKRCVAKVVRKDDTGFYQENVAYHLSRFIEFNTNDFSDECRSIIVFNLFSLTTEEELAAHFFEFGLETVNIFRNGREKFAILSFSKHTGATASLAHHGSTIGGRLNYIEVYRCSTLHFFMVPTGKVVEAYAELKLSSKNFMEKY